MSDYNDDPMYVIVYCNEGPDQGLVYLSRPLAGDEKMVARTFADEVANTLGLAISEPNGHIPNCSGDIRVEFLDHKPRIEAVADYGDRYQGSTRIWSGESYYFEQEG